MLEVFKNAVCFHTMAHQSVCVFGFDFVCLWLDPQGALLSLFFLRFIEIVFVFLQFEAEVFAYFLTTFVYFHLRFLTQHYTEYLEDSAGFLINI